MHIHFLTREREIAFLKGILNFYDFNLQRTLPLAPGRLCGKKSLVTLVALSKSTEVELKSLCWCVVSLACFKRFSASVALFIGPDPVMQWSFFPGNVMAFTPCFFFFSPLEKCNWTILWGGETLVPCREEEGLCVWSISDHAGQIHQHVCSIGWVEKYEVQCEERPFSLQAVSGKERQDPGFCCQDRGLPRDGSSCSFSDSFLFKSSPFVCGTGWDALTAVRQLRKSIFFMLFFQQQKVLLPFNAKLLNTSVLVYAKHS